MKDFIEDQKLTAIQHATIQGTLNEKITYLNEKVNNLTKKTEEIQENSIKELQEKNSIITGLLRKLEVFS